MQGTPTIKEVESANEAAGSERKACTADLRLPACLLIMDGYGLAPDGACNAITRAQTPVLDELHAKHPATQLDASGASVGLPEGQMGNSEVGHLNIGAGRVVYQELTRLNKACEEGSLRENPVITRAFERVKSEGRVLHLMGLLSDGGVHSSNEHLYALLKLAVELEVPRIFVHCFMDGRDVPPQSGAGFLAELEDRIAILNEELSNARAAKLSSGNARADGEHTDTSSEIFIASISGRYYAMDRDKRWERVERAYEALVCANPPVALSPAEVMRRSYGSGITDEFVEPVSLQERGIVTGDSVLFFNFRPDRAREISSALVDGNFDGFLRSRTVDVEFVCLTEYDPTIDAPVAFAKEFPENVLADVLAQAGLSQYRIAETEKYAHVTFFLNGGVEEPKSGESRTLIPSPKVATYDLKPEMSAPEVAATLAEAIEGDKADVYVVNFANCDMVGHTGIFEAAVAAVEAVDSAVGVVLAALREKRGIALLTADHGNADRMCDEAGKPFTAHTTAAVPLLLIDYSGGDLRLREEEGSLCDIAPTLLEMIGIPVPHEMTAKSLLANAWDARV